MVKVTIAHDVPSWPLSTGKNQDYGGAAPFVPGGIMLDLKRMKRILGVDEDLACVVVESGIGLGASSEGCVVNGQGEVYSSSGLHIKDASVFFVVTGGPPTFCILPGPHALQSS